MENELVLSEKELESFGYLFKSFLSHDLDKFYNRSNYKIIYKEKRSGVIYQPSGVAFVNREQFISYTNSGKIVEEKQEENLTLTHAELCELKFYVNGVYLNDSLNSYRNIDGTTEVYRNCNDGTILYRGDGSDYIPFKTMMEFLEYVGLAKAVSPNEVWNTMMDNREKKEPENQEDYHPCPNIQEALNEIMQDSKFNHEKPSLRNARSLKKKLEDEIIEKLNKFESETGCRINEVRFLKQNTISGNDDSYKNLINIIAVV